MSIYSILFGLSYAMKFVHSKQAMNVLIWSTIVTTAPIYAQVGMFYDPTASPNLPPLVTIVGSALCPPFAMANLLFIMLLFNNQYDGGVKLSNLFRETAIGASFGLIFFFFLVSIALQGFIVYFLVFKGSWWSSSDSKKSKEAFRKANESSPIDPSVWVCVRDLEKSFDAVHAVDGLTVDFKVNEITSFLGHNGAGKTTTIQVLTGLYKPENGDAFVCGKSILNDMNGVRSMISVCPQENVLWDTLTVSEHVEMWYQLRGLNYTSNDVVNSLAEFGLSDKIDSNAGDLSGGQKRKLQVALAFVGDPKVIYLDEPTAGMDTQARRDVWALLRRKKQGRSIILTTHFMDEADILGDNIAILHSGKLQVAGTSAQLKEQFGAGIHLKVTVEDGSNRESVLNFVQSVVGRAKIEAEQQVDDYGNLVSETDLQRRYLDQTSSGDLSILLPSDEDPAALASICRKLDEAKASKQLGISAYGFVSTTLEEVFVKLGEMDFNSSKVETSLGQQDGDDSSENASSLVPLLSDLNFVRPRSLTKIKYILLRRFKCETRNFRSLMSTILLPCVFVLICIGLLSIDYFPANPSNSAIIKVDALDMLRRPENSGSHRFQLPIVHVNSTVTDTAEIRDVLDALENFQDIYDDAPLATDVTSSWASSGDYGCFESYLIGGGSCSGKSSVLPFVKDPSAATNKPDAAPGSKIGAVVIKNETALDGMEIPEFSLILNASCTRSLFGLTTYIFDALLGNEGTAMLEPKFQELPEEPMSAEEKETRQRIENMVSFAIAPMFTVYGFLAAPSQMVYDLVKEKSSGLKHQQILMGIAPVEYWAANFIWDLFTKLFLTCPITLGLFALGASNLATFGCYLLLCAFCTSVTSISYCLSFLFDEPNVASGMTTTILMFGFLGTFILNFIIQTLDDSTQQLREAITTLGMILSPGLALSQGLTNLLMCNYYKKSPWQWNVDSDYVSRGIAEPLTYMLATTVLFAMLLLKLEDGSVGR